MTAPQKYRNRPVEVTAVGPLTRENRDEIASWCNGIAKERMRSGPGRGVMEVVSIHMLKQDMDVFYGDYVVRNERGEYHRCPANVFAATYEAVSE